MIVRPQEYVVRLRPRADTLYMSQSRTVLATDRDGLHEDIDLTNFTQQKTAFTLTLEVDADFADIDVTKGERQQKGETKREWREADGAHELHYDYKVKHTYSNQEWT
jgi:glycogen debranching enzyme